MGARGEGFQPRRDRRTLTTKVLSRRRPLALTPTDTQPAGHWPHPWGPGLRQVDTGSGASALGRTGWVQGAIHPRAMQMGCWHPMSLRSPGEDNLR